MAGPQLYNTIHIYTRPGNDHKNQSVISSMHAELYLITGKRTERDKKNSTCTRFNIARNRRATRAGGVRQVWDLIKMRREEVSYKTVFPSYFYITYTFQKESMARHHSGCNRNSAKCSRRVSWAARSVHVITQP